MRLSAIGLAFWVIADKNVWTGRYDMFLWDVLS